GSAERGRSTESDTDRRGLAGSACRLVDATSRRRIITSRSYVSVVQPSCKMTNRAAAMSGFGWGVIGGLALVALMYFSSGLFGLRPLPQALNGPLLSLMPGFVFGFLIDKLQHAGKVVEEIGLILAMVVALAAVGAASAVANLRWTSTWVPFAFAGAAWAIVVLILLPVAGLGWLGLNDGLTTPVTWAALIAFSAV